MQGDEQVRLAEAQSRDAAPALTEGDGDLSGNREILVENQHVIPYDCAAPDDMDRETAGKRIRDDIVEHIPVAVHLQPGRRDITQR